MLWLLFVGSPASGKTELLKLIKKNKKVLTLDTLTQNSFISGERVTKENKVYDLLGELNSTCLVIKDWTAVFSTDERQTKKIIGDLVGIYDKSFEKYSSARGKISYEAEFSHLGAITPATLNKHHNYLNMIGPRFLFYSIPTLSKAEEDASFTAIFNKADRKGQEQIVGKLVNEYLNYLNGNINARPNYEFTSKTKDFFKVAARFLARGRGIVVMQQSSFTAEGGNEVSYYEPLEVQIEQPFRAVQQLMVLAEYLAYVANHDEISEQDLEVIKEIVIGSMPADRSQALRALKNSPEGEITAKQLSEDTEKSTKTARRLLEELSSLGLVEKLKGSGTLASTYKFVDEFKPFILGTVREFMSPNKPIDLPEGEISEKSSMKEEVPIGLEGIWNE